MTFSTHRWSVLLVGLLLSALFAVFFTAPPPRGPSTPDATVIKSTSSPHASFESKAARQEYFFRLMRDPATNRIPKNIRSRELQHARTVPIQMAKSRTPGRPFFTWSEAGPSDVGGRTRALGVDQRNRDILLAGGVSGGIWKSVDGGQSWQLKTTADQVLGVTALRQDPTNQDTWYAATGEFLGSSDDRSGRARYYGSGFYRSSDNGETWTELLSAGSPVAFDSALDFVSNIAVSPTTGTLFIGSSSFGVLRSTDGGETFTLDTTPNDGNDTGGIGGFNDHAFADVAVTDAGHVIAVLSSALDRSSVVHAPGVYLSLDDGLTWSSITPSEMPSFRRGVVAHAPSDPNIFYVLTYGQDVFGDQQMSFFKFRLDLSNNRFFWDNRSANVPAYTEPNGTFNAQGGYNLMLAVKPDDPDFVLMGGTNLYRSLDGFATPINNNLRHWIGGYAPPTLPADGRNGLLYPTQHPDQHAGVFDPTNPNRYWSGNDGGIYVSTDVTASVVSWQDKNAGYHVTQFYTVDLPNRAGDAMVGGGTQDNGTPYFDSSTPLASTTDISGADGGPLYLGDQVTYASIQNGLLRRWLNDASGRPTTDLFVTAPGQNIGQLFIHPFAVDPNDENVVYYPAGRQLWRTTNGAVPQGLPSWTSLNGILLPTGCTMSTISASTDPAHVVYYGADCGFQSPRIYRLANANTATGGAQEISIPGIPAGAYVHDIAINPTNADEILVVHSNYNVVGLYHSTDGGQSYQAVEGNLEGSNSTPGPSLRAAAILPGEGATGYLVGTSTGLYSTTQLNGSGTIWAREGANTIGNAVTEALDARPEDYTVAAATHGRGIFLGSTSAALPVELSGFGATLDGGTARLTWQTASETNNAGFHVERAVGESADFRQIGFVDGNGTTEIAQRYRFTDTALPFEAERLVYRLRQVDLDGTASLSSEVSVEIGDPVTVTLHGVFPNPVRSAATLRYELPEATSVRLELYDLLGRRVKTLVDAQQPAGRQEIAVDASHLPAGVYVYRLMTGRHVQTQRMTVVQ